ncbi:MAG: hypothetical protein ICV68_17410 [Pyrinomonadaceae bacterium]|nr:hypothetical protein [Pyrinomonadaceae bacterium]
MLTLVGRYAEVGEHTLSVRAGADGPWRASAQSTVTQQVYYFAHVEELFAFLLERLAAEAEEPPSPLVH